MKQPLDGNAVVYCQGAFETTNGKTAHGLVRFTDRYGILAVIDSTCAGRDAGEILDGIANGIPVARTLDDVFESAPPGGEPRYFVMGLAPEGGRLNPEARRDVKEALSRGLNVDCGLHDFLSEDPEMAAIAQRTGATIRDVRKPPSRDKLHFFSGKIERVGSFRVAVLGTDSAVGKRTTAWLSVKSFREAGFSSEMIGTGQTAWLQGARYGVILDSLVNDFVSGEIEHAVWNAWSDIRPDVMVVEGQGSLMNPAYPGGFEILAAARPDAIVVQHAPARKDYDGFPGYPIHPLERQIQVLELLSDRPVAAVTINHEGLDKNRVPEICASIQESIGLPVFDVLLEGAGGLVNELRRHMRQSVE